MAQKALLSSPGRIAEVDQLDYLVVMDIEHHKIHSQKHYCVTDYDADVDTGAKYWFARTPTIAVDPELWHLTFEFSSSRRGVFEVFWNPTINAVGTPVLFVNNNFNSLNEASILCYKDPTVGADGNRFFVRSMGDDVVGASKGSADKVERQHERILKPGKDYLFKFTAIDDNTRVSVGIHVYQ